LTIFLNRTLSNNSVTPSKGLFEAGNPPIYRFAFDDEAEISSLKYSKHGLPESCPKAGN
jgi:hypothetical protein